MFSIQENKKTFQILCYNTIYELWEFDYYDVNMYMIHEQSEEYLVRTTRFSNTHQNPNNSPEISETENC